MVRVQVAQRGICSSKMVFGLTIIERYLYSLPEYCQEIQKSNFIEIYSYNGLLATRKVIGMFYIETYSYNGLLPILRVTRVFYFLMGESCGSHLGEIFVQFLIFFP